MATIGRVEGEGGGEEEKGIEVCEGRREGFVTGLETMVPRVCAQTVALVFNLDRLGWSF